MDSEHESKLVSLISEIMSFTDTMEPMDPKSKFLSLITQIVSLLSTMDLVLQPKPESELISLTAQIVSLLRSMDLDSQPKPLSKLISFISQTIFPTDSRDSDSKQYTNSKFMSLFTETLSLEPEPELISLIHQIFSLVIATNSKWKNLISLCPQVQVNSSRISNGKWACLPFNWMIFRLTGKDATHFICLGCNGENHEENEKAPVKVKHLFHPKHSLQLVFLDKYSGTRTCNCCAEDLLAVYYYCSACNYAMNIACVERPPLIAIDHPTWHEHTLALFPRQVPPNCNLCSLADSSSPVYMCPPCNFVVHKRCLGLSRVIRISRHLHRISFTPSFDQEDLSCDICHKDIDNDYGGYSCSKFGCSYVSHSRCATYTNVWDGIELEEEPEEIEEVEESEPFVMISDGIIQHFSHQHHHLKLEESTGRDYDDNMECQACILPIFFGNFYSCMQCDFILHERCATYPRKIYHPIHQHQLTLVGGNDGVTNHNDSCSVCQWLCTGFYYQCEVEECEFFKLHVQCAAISEPLVHESHHHPLFLTSRPGERRYCSVCNDSRFELEEKFNCVECDFALCFRCATLPSNVRYIDDKHLLTVSYGKTTSVRYWCEVCEGQIDPKGRFYLCSDNCCVTLHIECLFGEDFYIKPGSSLIYFSKKLDVLRNNSASQPICTFCHRRCPQKVYFHHMGSIACSLRCVMYQSV